MLCKNKLANLDIKSKTNNAKHILLPFSFFFCVFFLYLFLFFYNFGKEITKTIQNEMHECYAMQILEKQRKQKQQRRMVTKSRAMKHKDNESQRRSGTQNHTNYLTKCLKFTSISRDILKSHNLSFNKIHNKVISYLYVFSLRVLNRVLRDINSTRIITINNHGVLCYPIIT